MVLVRLGGGWYIHSGCERAECRCFCGSDEPLAYCHSLLTIRLGNVKYGYNHLEETVMRDRTQRRIVCAAISKGGQTILGARHFDKIMHQVIEQIAIGKIPGFQEYMRDADQGFIDQWGKFMTREEAFEVATAAGQILEKTGNPDSKELFSEDLY
jgi:hypothetical protein